MLSPAAPGILPRFSLSRLPRTLALLLALSLAPSLAQTPAKPAPRSQTPLTREQARDLLASVDDILAFASADTALPITRPVKRRLVSRDEVTRYLQMKFEEDESARRLQHGEIVLKKFGLLDRDFQLRPFLITLLTEQIAGFYDEKTRTVNLLDYVDPDEQKPVLAHELTHALQDMRVDLLKWSDPTPPGDPVNVQQDNRRLQLDESGTTRESVTEGQAMVTFLDYTLRSSGKTLADAPELADRLKDTVADTSDSPVMARAPLLLQQTLMFPYAEGLSFEAAVLAQGGKAAAFAGTLSNPPSSTFEIIHPKAYLSHTPVPVLPLPDLRPLMPQFSFYDLGVMGELDVRILAELFGGRAIANALSPEWSGGVYYAAQRKSATAAEKLSPASLALLYVSRWKNRDSARSFLNVYAEQLPRKYSGLKSSPCMPGSTAETDTEQCFTTNEGDIFLTASGSFVYTFEGFPLAQARTLRDAIAAIQTEGPIHQAAAGPSADDLLQPLTHLRLFTPGAILHAAQLIAR